MTDLIVIHPGAQSKIYGALADDKTALEPPTWARMIAGYVRKRGYSITIVDQEAERLDAITAAETALRAQPQLIAIVVSGHQPSASTQQMTAAGAVAFEIKLLRKLASAARIHPNIASMKVVMLGNHPSALPERTLREESIDYVAVGEGPVTIDALLRLPNLAQPTFRDLRTVPGLVFWDNWQIYKNTPAALIEDLDQNLHGDVWDLLPMNRYRAHEWHALGVSGGRAPYASIYTSLNCPYSCHFCMISTIFGDKKYRRFSPKHVVDQISHLYHKYGVKNIKFADEMFLLHEGHYMEICDRLLATGFAQDLNIWAYARVDTVKPNTLQKLRSAGFRWLALGIESASAHVRDGAAKRLKTADIVGTVRAIQNADINVVGNFIFGLPDDTADTMQDTLDLALECLPEHANFYSAMAYPGSKLYDDALVSGVRLPETWVGYSQHSYECRPLATVSVDAETVLRFRDYAHNRYFTDPDYLAMITRKFGPAARLSIEEGAKIRLPRRLLGDAP